ncbi:hypothetical protein R5R35_004266 [Gryllus longicercus]|uniref:Autophagy-related protein 2 n=1 Tax=Gryllus longicercus TaxID=2509291 RepID=A0AAN9ZEK8_9ORTH
MPWYLPWSESIKKRACRYLLQRYLGQFLEEKLTLDQLTVDLYNGIGSVSCVKLDVQALNELGEQQNLPVEFVDGYISEMSVSIPWASLLSDSSYVEVNGLLLTVQPKQRADTGVSMFESMWSSMSSSMQIAEECLKQSSEGNKEQAVDQGQPLEGLELFAQTIDSILSRVKVKFVNTTIRLEHVPKESVSGVALELRIRNIDYFDEAGADPPMPPSGDPQLHQANKVYQVAAFTTKAFYLEGVVLYTDEFPSRARTFSRSVMSLSTSSSPESKLSESVLGSPVPADAALPKQMEASSHSPLGDRDSLSSSRHSDMSTSERSVGGGGGGGLGSGAGVGNLAQEPDPVAFGRLVGRQELRVRLKQSEVALGPKVQLEVSCGSLLLFLSARQLHLLLELVEGLAAPDLEDTSNVAPRVHCVEKPMEAVDFRRVEQELQQQLLPSAHVPMQGLQGTQGWSTAALEESDSEEEFLPMAGGMSESIMSEASSMAASTCSSASSSAGKGSHRYSTPCASFAQSGAFAHEPRKKAHKGGGASGHGLLESEMGVTEVSRFHLRLASLALVLLHEDVLTPCSGPGSDGSLARSSVQQMKATADNFFQGLGQFGSSSFGGKDFVAARDVFLGACHLNHIRLLAAPVVMEGSERATAQGCALSGTLTAMHLELLECLVDKGSAQQLKVEYVELLKFPGCEDNAGQGFPGEPSLRLQYKFHERVVHQGHNKRSMHPRTDIYIALQTCSSEIDVSIVDRITAVLNPQPLCRRNVNKFAMSGGKSGVNQHSGFYQAVEVPSSPDCKTSIKVSSPFLSLKLRFPTPDLRPIHDMDRPPWWKRSVRKDFLTFELTDASFSTTMDSHEASQRYEIQCREIHGLFQEADTETPVTFARASADDKNGNSLPDGGQGFGWPRLVVTVFPEAPAGELEDAMDQDSDEGSMRHSSMDHPMDRGPPEPSPFSSKRVVHESDTPHSRAKQHSGQPESAGNATAAGEELIIPGDKQEMASFMEYASQSTRLHLEMSLPSASVHLPSKHLYELIYNRVNTDMFLWEPSAPKPQPGSSAADGYGVRAAAGVELSTFLQDTLYTTFSMCKSGIQYESDSDSEDAEGVYYSVYEQRQRQRRRQQLEGGTGSRQSHTALSLAIGQGALSVFTPVRDSGGNVIPGQHGELLIQFEEGSLFSVSGYRGRPGLGYICLQVHQAAFYHNGLVANPQEPVVLPVVGAAPPAHLQATIYHSEPGATVTPGAPDQDMLSVAIKVELEDSLHHLKTFRVAAGLRGATLRHRMGPSPHSWFTQFVDFFDVIDYPIAGYDPPGVITELQLHLWSCAVDYRPLHLPLRSLITMGSFSVASNIAAHTSTSTLRFIAEEAALFLSDQAQEDRPVDLRKDYVCVVDLGLFELSLRLCSQQTSGVSNAVPRVDLRASNNVLHVRTCADSGKALTELLTYFASDGDLKPAAEEGSVSQSQNSSAGEVDGSRGSDVLMAVGNDNERNGNSLSQSQVAHVHTMMEEAMKESSFTSHRAGPPKATRNKRGVEVFFFPDEANVLASKALADSELFQKEETEENEDSWEEDFCILDKEAGSGFLPRNSLPEVRLLTSEPVRLIDNHFAVPLGKTDLLRAPKGYPAAVLRYTLREMTVIWHMYGGHDFGPASGPGAAAGADEQRVPESKSCPSSPPFSSPRSSPSTGLRPRGSVSFSKSTPTEVHFAYHYPAPHSPRANSPQQPLLQPAQVPLSWQAQGGPGRQHDVLMELQLNKVRFQHEVYPESAYEASRQVLLVSDVELRDRLASSQINKFLYQYSSEARPKQSHANMIVIKAVHVRPDPRLPAQECTLRVSLLPLRLNIDQDSLLFLFSFFTDISGRKSTEDESSSSSTSSGGGLSGGTPRHSTPTHAPPVMTVNVEACEQLVPQEPQALLILLEDELSSAIGTAEDEGLGVDAQRQMAATSESSRANAGGPLAPIYFRNFVFTRDVPIRLDYQGKRVDMTHGPLAGLLMGLGQLNCSELRLKRLSYRHGLLGFDKLVAFALAEWLRDIKKHQLPSLLGGVGPLHALVQLFQGLRDLFWLPIEQYQKDGRIVRGLQRGANSFTTSTAMAGLELMNRLVQAIQATAELAYDMVSPGPSVRCLRAGRGQKGRRRRRLAQPADLREGVANALAVVREGLGETAQALVRAASEEHELKGMSGAVGGVLRQIPPTALKPILMATEATANVLGGMRSQLAPDVRREAQDKWRAED